MESVRSIDRMTVVQLRELAKEKKVRLPYGVNKAQMVALLNQQCAPQAAETAEEDKENGEIYLRARYYNSECGRFVTEDPSKYGANWYSYCDNNPVTMVDGTGLRPTTDGSAGSDEIANDYMIATYYKQQASAHPEMTQPAPEPPKTTRGKWSKNTFKTELPVNFRYYNVDRTEFEPPFDIENTIAKADIDNNEDIMNLFRMTPYYYKTSTADQAKVAALARLETQLEFGVLVYSKI